MVYIMLQNMQIVLFFGFIVERFKKVFMCHFGMSSIVVYYTTIIPKILNKVAHFMEFKIVKGLSTSLGVN